MTIMVNEEATVITNTEAIVPLSRLLGVLKQVVVRGANARSPIWSLVALHDVGEQDAIAITLNGKRLVTSHHTLFRVYSKAQPVEARNLQEGDYVIGYRNTWRRVKVEGVEQVRERLIRVEPAHSKSVIVVDGVILQ